MEQMLRFCRGELRPRYFQVQTEALLGGSSSAALARSRGTPPCLRTLSVASVPTAAQAPLVHQAFESQAAACPAARCLCTDDASMSYGDVASASAALAARLTEAGAGPGAPVGIMLDRGFGMVVAMLAALRAGAAYVGLDPSFPAAR